MQDLPMPLLASPRQWSEMRSSAHASTHSAGSAAHPASGASTHPRPTAASTQYAARTNAAMLSMGPLSSVGLGLPLLRRMVLLSLRSPGHLPLFALV